MSHRILVVGGGAGGLELASRLGRTLGKSGKAEITLIDSCLTHVWKPLLHEIAAGSFDDCAHELNFVAQAKRNHFQFQLGALCGLDRSARTIRVSATLDEQGVEVVPRRNLGYDTLVIAVGSVTNDFGTPHVAEHCVFLDTPAQAERFHRELLGHYLRAHAGADKDAKLEIAIVGAGATGIELAAELCNTAGELADYGLGSIRPENMRITVLDAGSRPLPGLPELVSEQISAVLQKLGVTVLTSSKVAGATSAGVLMADGTIIPAPLTVWAAGIMAPPFLKDIDGLESNRTNQLIVRQTLQVTRDDDIFAFGDCSACPMDDASGKNVPATAQAAHQQAAFLARSIEGLLGGKPLPAYSYRDFGTLVSLSRYGAVGNLAEGFKVKGWLARTMYVSLYRMHQLALLGFLRTGFLMLGDVLSRRSKPRLKLH